MQSAIVCVDDEFEILQCLGEQLKRRFGKDHIIELARSGDDAIALCQELSDENIPIAVIISDQNMIGMEGDEMLIRLHQTYPDTLKIMLTGEANAHAIGNIVNNDALYRYISKPWDKTDLLMTVAEAIKRFEQEAIIQRQTELLRWTNTKLENSLSLLLATLDATADAILVLGQTGKVMIYNQQFTQLWNIKANDAELMAQDILQLIAQQVQDNSKENLSRLLKTNNTNQGELYLDDLRVIEYYARHQQLAGESVGVVVSFRDVTELKHNAAIMKQQAFHDSLTNLPNRVQFNTILNHHLQGYENSFAVMFLDLDHFKQVNDSFGHTAGDMLLKQAVERLNECLREHDCLARWGGDEFVLLLPNIKHKQNLDQIAERLIGALEPVFHLNEHEAYVTTSIGIALYPHHGNDAQTLLNHADLALYAAKESGKNTYRYFSEVQEKIEFRKDVQVPQLAHSHH